MSAKRERQGFNLYTLCVSKWCGGDLIDTGFLSLYIPRKEWVGPPDLETSKINK